MGRHDPQLRAGDGSGDEERRARRGRTRPRGARGPVPRPPPRLPDALREFTTATQLDAKRADAFTLLGVANSPPFPGNAAAAVAAFQKASALDPADVVSEDPLGRQLSRGGKTEEAAKSWRRVADNFRRRLDERVVATASPFMTFGIVEERSGVEPFFPPAIYADGFALLAKGDYAAAIASFRSSSSRDPLVADETNRYGMRRAADAFRDGAIDTAVEQLQAAIELAPSGPNPTGSSGWSGRPRSNTTAAPTS